MDIFHRINVFVHMCPAYKFPRVRFHFSTFSTFTSAEDNSQVRVLVSHFHPRMSTLQCRQYKYTKIPQPLRKSTDLHSEDRTNGPGLLGERLE